MFTQIVIHFKVLGYEVVNVLDKNVLHWLIIIGKDAL